MGLRRGLIAFDLSSIPTNATITRASLSMYLSRTGPVYPDDISLSKALHDWGEGASNAGDPGGQGTQAQTGDATWLHTFYNTSFWTTPGGDFSPTLSATTTVEAWDTTYQWSGAGLLADVQSWVANPASNFGWVVLGNEIDSGSAARFGSRENATNQPRLNVTFQVPSPTPTPAATATPTPAATATPSGTPTPTPVATPTPTASPTPTPSPTTKAINLSTRMRVQTGDNVGIGGFIITGSTPKHVLIRAIGPSLTGFGVPNVLADPVLELHGPGAFVTITNDNWRDTQEAEILSTGIPPADDLESAIVATLAPGAYTAIVRGNGNTSGVALVEVYDLNQGVDSKLANLSTRAFVSTGDNIVIAGFMLGGNSGDDRIVVRGIGPSLTAVGVPDALADPTLELRDSNGTLLFSNNDWQDNAVQAAEIAAAGLAPTNNLESGIAATLPPGLYTALLAGLNNGTGIGLVEVYDRGAMP